MIEYKALWIKLQPTTPSKVNKSSPLRCLWRISILWALTIPALAAIEAVTFSSPEMEKRYQDIIAELRCLVCQNQNLADSNAELAKDLRHKAAEMIKNGNSNREVLEYMRERYGDFVLYRPPLNKSTAVLWAGPFILLMFVIGVVLVRLKSRQQSATGTTTTDEADRIEVRKLLENAPELTANRSSNHDS